MFMRIMISSYLTVFPSFSAASLLLACADECGLGLFLPAPGFLKDSPSDRSNIQYLIHRKVKTAIFQRIDVAVTEMIPVEDLYPRH